MKLFTPQISWHNRMPVLCLDIATMTNPDTYYKLATGGNDCKVYIWNMDESNGLKIRAGLRRHQRSIGALRFSPNGELIASGDDDGYIYLWKYNGENSAEQIVSGGGFANDDDVEDLESWKQLRVLRGHVDDICDLSWSRDGTLLLSGSVDNSAILWNIDKSIKIWVSDPSTGYVQGVAIDPLDEFIIALSSDRTMRVYNVETKRLIYSARKMKIQNSSNMKALFCDDTLQTFCRRPEFSPCGKFLLVPSGLISEEGSKPINVCYLFSRAKLNKPYLYYPTDKENSLCIRFCPKIFQLRNDEQNFWGLPYRLIFAIATSRSLLIYDSQQPSPICYASHIHMARLTDLAWSDDGLLLTASSYDGYCTVVSFSKDELGEKYTEDVFAEETKSEPEEIIVEPPKKIEVVPQPVINDIRKYMVCKKVPTIQVNTEEIKD